MTKYFHFILISLTVMLTSCGSGTPPAPAPSVVVEHAQLKDITQTTSYAGTIQTLYTVELLPRISGYLQKRTFHEGQTVEAGDLLFVIEPDQYQATVLQKQADLASSEAILVERTLNVERMRVLLEKKVVAQAIKDQAESNYSTALANVKAAQAALANAELDLSYTQIHAPMGGRIGVATVSPGDYIAPGMPALATIVQIDPIRAVFSLSEHDWLSLETKENRTASNIAAYLTPYLRLADGSDYPTPGTIEFIDNHINADTGSIAVYALFENKKGLLLPGQFITVLLQEGAAHPALMVPSGAVLFDKTGHYLLIVDADNKVAQRYVKTGLTQNGYTEITEGLSASDQFIVQGLQKVTPGILVTKTTAPKV